MQRLKLIILAVGSVSFLLCPLRIALASTNIVSAPNSSHWAWNDVIGWIDFYGTDAMPFDVNMNSDGMTGSASSSVSWISFDCATSPAGDSCGGGSTYYKVTNDGAGNLGGWAWNDVIGWISFCGQPASLSNCQVNPNSTYQVKIDASGNFYGYAWNDAVGWISFNCGGIPGPDICATSQYKVATTWTVVVTAASGHLDSSTFDTGIAGGAQINSIVWHGSMPSPADGASVGFQFAISNASTGPWSYAGPDNTSTTYYGIGISPGNSIPVSYNLHNNARYFRYRITLSSNGTQTVSPRVDDVSVNWSR